MQKGLLRTVLKPTLASGMEVHPGAQKEKPHPELPGGPSLPPHLCPQQEVDLMQCLQGSQRGHVLPEDSQGPDRILPYFCRAHRMGSPCKSQTVQEGSPAAPQPLTPHGTCRVTQQDRQGFWGQAELTAGIWEGLEALCEQHLG